MARICRTLCMILAILVLAQPVFAETAELTPPAPDFVTAVHTVEAFPDHFDSLSLNTAEHHWLAGLITAPLYELSADGGWIPVLAAALPEDVTAAYAGAYEIPAHAQRGYAYRIRIHEDACLEDGTPITADDCISSILALFEAENTAADWLFLANADAIRTGKTRPGTDIVSLKDAGFANAGQAWAAGYTEFYLDTEGFWGLGAGWRSVSDRTRIRDFAMPGGLDEYFVTPAYLYNFYLMDGAASSRYQSEFIGICPNRGDAFTMADLGIVKENAQEFVIVLQNPLTASTLMQKLENFMLVSVDSPLSFGPYRIVSCDGDRMILEPNPNWWGAADPRGYDRIICSNIGT